MRAAEGLIVSFDIHYIMLYCIFKKKFFFYADQRVIVFWYSGLDYET